MALYWYSMGIVKNVFAAYWKNLYKCDFVFILLGQMNTKIAQLVAY